MKSITVLYVFISSTAIMLVSAIAIAQGPLTAQQAYTQGAIALKAGNLQSATSNWRQFVALAPDSPLAVQVRQHLTVITKKLAEQTAKQALSAETQIGSAVIDTNTIAVTNFQNLGSATLAPLGKGLTAMLITDLKQIPTLQVTERVNMQALVDEIQLSQQSFLVSQKTAPQVGRLLRANQVVSGNMIDPEVSSLQLTSSVTKSVTSAIIATQQATGPMMQFFQLEKTIVKDMTTHIGINSLPTTLMAPHTKSFKSFASFSKGLDLTDKGQYPQAKAAFQDAVALDPNFALAQSALLATPTSAFTIGQIIQSVDSMAASTSGVSTGGGSGSANVGAGAGATSGSSVAVSGSVAGSAQAASSAAIGGVGIGTVAAGIAITAAIATAIVQTNNGSSDELTTTSSSSGASGTTGTQ